MADRTTTGAAVLDDRPGPVRLRTAFLALLVVFGAEVVLIGGYLLLAKLGALPRPGPAATVALLAVATIVAATVLHAVLIRRSRLSLHRLGFVRPTWRLLHLLWQAPLAILTSAAVAAAVLRLTTGSTVRPDRDGDLAGFGTAGPAVAVAAVVIAVIATPLWEEALFRGAFYLGFSRLVGPAGAVVGSAAVFAAFHVIPAVWAFVFPLGLFLGWIRWFHRNLWATAAVHALNNLLAMSAFFLAT